jgi:hypothetical protein
MYRVPSFILFGLLSCSATALAAPPKPGVYVVESACETGATCPKILVDSKNVPKGTPCDKPPQEAQWKVPSDIDKEHLKAASALAEQANARPAKWSKDPGKMFCYIDNYGIEGK